MERRRWRITPKTVLGWWSVGLIVAMPCLFFIGTAMADWFYDSMPAGGTLWGDIVARPALALIMLSGMGAGIGAFITGLLGIIRKKERGVLVYISTVIGALLILFLAGEVITPH